MTTIHHLRTLALGALVVGTFGLAACGQPERETPPKSPADKPVNYDELPEWANNPTMGGEYPLAASASSEPSMAGAHMTRDRALARARTELARTVQVKIQSMFRDWTREGGEITSNSDTQMAMAMSENASQVITNQVIQVCQLRRAVVDRYGREWVWVYIDKEEVKQLQSIILQTARVESEKRSHFASKIEADKAYAQLQALIDKEMGITPAAPAPAPATEPAK
jgi:hypothetical protein